MTSLFCLFLVAGYFILINCSKWQYKDEYKPYGPKMCRRLCQESGDVFYFLENTLSCNRIQTRGADGCNRKDTAGLVPTSGLHVCDTDTDDGNTKRPKNTEISSTIKAGLNTVTNNHNISLHQACEEGNLCDVQFILSHNLSDINLPGKLRRTPVMAAAVKQQVAVFDFLVSQGCDLTAVDKNNNTVLHVACMGGNVDIVRKLVVDLKHDIECEDFHGWTPVFMSAFHGHMALVKFLVQNGCKLTHVDFVGNTVLHVVCSAGHVDIVNHILDKAWIGIDSKGEYKITPVMCAAIGGHLDVVKFLANRSCDLSVVDSYGNNILHVACQYGHLHVVKYILDELNIGINSKGQYERTPVMYAAAAGHLDVVKFLANRSCDLSVVDSYGNNILHVACLGGHLHVVKYILDEAQIDIDSKGQYKRTPVMCAAVTGHLDVVKFLANRSCDLSVVSCYEKNLLHEACWYGHLHVVKYILDEVQIDIDSKGPCRRTPVVCAAKTGQLDVVKFLANRSCDVNVLDSYGNNLLHVACQYGHLHVVKYILDELNIDIDSKGQYERTPVMWAAYRGNIDLIKLLVEKGCNLKAEDKNKWNALHFACYRGNEEAVRFLLTTSVEKKARDSHGRTPLQIAVRRRNTRIVKPMRNLT